MSGNLITEQLIAEAARVPKVDIVLRLDSDRLLVVPFGH